MKEMPSLSHSALTHIQRRLLNLYHLIWTGLGVMVLAVLAAGYWFYQQGMTAPPDPPGVQTLVPPEAAPAFTLVDHHGKAFSRAQLLGKWTIMFFGYTHCPDFCPTTLAALNNTYHRLEREKPKLASTTQVVFVSLDPFRDTPPVLADYIAHFNAHFIGVTGTPAQLHRLTQPLGASYDYTDPISGGPLGDTTQRPRHDYAVDHGAGFYVFDDRARITAWVLPPHTADRIVSVYEHIRILYE
jgi:protein SCO1/2